MLYTNEYPQSSLKRSMKEDINIEIHENTKQLIDQFTNNEQFNNEQSNTDERISTNQSNSNTAIPAAKSTLTTLRNLFFHHD
jgi:hypothetical protein